MNWSRLKNSGNETVFRGSQLVSSVLERHHTHFRSRAAALKFCRQLFNDGVIRGVFGADTFEDSVQLYTWYDPNGSKMTSYPQKNNTQPTRYGLSSADVTLTRRDLQRQRVPIKTSEETPKRSPSKSNMYSPDMNSYFKDLESDITDEHDDRLQKHMSSNHYPATLNIQRASTASSESSVDILSHSFHRHKEKQHSNQRQYNMPVPAQTRDHAAIPEEVQEDHVMERTGTSTEYDGSSSIPRSVTTDSSNPAHEMDSSTQRRWQDYQNSYSDNEKQLIEQMKRMKKEHSHILRTYEDRINKLMTKMHELRNIAEMLENSSSKSSPYGMINNRPGLLNFLGSKPDADRKPGVPGYGDLDQPPPLPPRPGRANRLNPNKPLIKTGANMKPLPWVRIILKDEGDDDASTIWHTMAEPQIDPEEVERLFSTPESSPTDGATLYDDLIIRRGRSRQQLVSIYDTERSKRIVICMKCLRATLNDVISTVSSLDTSQINHDGLAELLELLSSARDIEKILHHVRKKGAGYLDHPEYLVFELSKVDHFKDRLEFIRFRYKTQWHLFEIDQQLRELHTACNEVTNSMSLKNLLETLLSVGNYLNSATEMAQADGFGLDVLNKLKETQDRDGKSTLLEFVLKTYCQIYENEVDIGCPTRFRLPEPSNMRHAAQVSFEGISDALSNLNSDIKHVREKLLDPAVNKDTMRPMDSFRVTAENFFAAAMEVIGDQAKTLMDTRDLFDKTVAYFLVEERDMTPQQFFHIWAVFLHDCKYYWKLAHRRLTRERFELEFKYKGQMSSNSLQGGYGSFRAGVLSSSGPTEHKTSTQSRQLNKWMKSLEDPNKPSVPPKPARAEKANPQTSEFMTRSPSPKPLTSTPPTTAEVYKPLPQTPLVTSPIPNGHVPNYENQSECDRYLAKQAKKVNGSPDTLQSRHMQYPGSEQSKSGGKDKKSSQNFSLKAWLKREREQVRKGVENGPNEAQQQQSYESPKEQSSSKSFSKLKNSMMQRFSGGSSNKKHESERKRQREVRDIISPQRVDRYDVRDPNMPYDVLRNNYVDANQPQIESDNKFETEETTQVDSLGVEYKTTVSDGVISPIDDPDAEPSPILPNGHIDITSPKLTGTVLPTRHSDSTVIRSDMNNNNSPNVIISPHKNSPWQRPERGRDNYNINYSPHQNDGMHRKQDPEVSIHSPGAESKCVRGESVPVYKAKIINNYENQGKFENMPGAVRQHAEPVSHPRDTKTVSDYNRYQHQSPYARFQQSRQKDNHNTAQDLQRTHGNNFVPKASSREQSPRTHSRHERKAGHGHKKSETSKKHTGLLDNQNYTTPGNRVPMNVQSIGSLIDRFDKYNNNESTQVSENVPSNQHCSPLSNGLYTPEKTNSINTPSQSQRHAFNGESEEMSPPLPPRSRHKGPSSENNTPVGRDISSHNSPQTFSASSTRLQKHASPYTRLDNLTVAQQGSPHQTLYSSPQLNGHIIDESNNNSPYHTPPRQPSYVSRATRYNDNDVQGDYLQQSSASAASSGYHGGGSALFHSGTSVTSSGYNTGGSRLHQSGISATSLGTHSQGYNGYTPSAFNGLSPRNDGDHVPERDDGYRAQLRKAANMNHSAYDRLNKSPPYTGRASLDSNFQRPGISSYGSTAVVKPTVHNNEEVAYMAI